jgi:hypothetical protein
MRPKAEIHLESGQYADLFPPLDIAHGIPGAGDELVLADVSYTCVSRRFEYDAAGHLKNVGILVKR